MGREGVQLQGVALPSHPASFQGNRDESTNVDMALVQRDVQVSVMPLTWLPEPGGWSGGDVSTFLHHEGGVLG